MRKLLALLIIGGLFAVGCSPSTPTGKGAPAPTKPKMDSEKPKMDAEKPKMEEPKKEEPKKDEPKKDGN
jgi:hypothetical protein